ncbi:hypothetical protein IFM89_035773 [Coptis chinensis]|uniref:Uncharacterized protein n=1 Tax=Coptis chinensis TaxID=261450 RepID=A0A835I9I2_9MAGN|nr:hypothetical protein IFM89_035773 [Coptis chinensis]
MSTNGDKSGGGFFASIASSLTSFGNTMQKSVTGMLSYEGLEVINPEGGKEDAEAEAHQGRWKEETIDPLSSRDDLFLFHNGEPSGGMSEEVREAPPSNQQQQHGEVVEVVNVEAQERDVSTPVQTQGIIEVARISKNTAQDRPTPTFGKSNQQDSQNSSPWTLCIKEQEEHS